jgi:hypothetical protein
VWAWEASGHARWFERLLSELQFELWIGDAAEIQSKPARKQKTDRQDAQHILTLMLKDDFPQIWVPGWENRDLRQLLWHRHRMVQARTRIMNQLQAVALNEGLRCKKRLWRAGGREQLESFRLAPWASRRRHDLLELLDRLNPTIAELSQAIEQAAEKHPEATTDDTSGCGRVDRTGLRADHRKRGTFFVWEASRELSRTGAAGKVQRESAAARAYHQTRKFHDAFLACRSGPGHGAQLTGMAPSVLPSDAAPGAEDGKSGDGTPTGDPFVLDVAPRIGLRAVQKFGSHAGEPGNRDGVPSNTE